MDMITQPMQKGWRRVCDECGKTEHSYGEALGLKLVDFQTAVTLTRRVMCTSCRDDAELDILIDMEEQEAAALAA